MNPVNLLIFKDKYHIHPAKARARAAEEHFGLYLLPESSYTRPSAHAGRHLHGPCWTTSRLAPSS
jgi:hypothetical protein